MIMIQFGEDRSINILSKLHQGLYLTVDHDNLRAFSAKMEHSAMKSFMKMYFSGERINTMFGTTDKNKNYKDIIDETKNMFGLSGIVNDSIVEI
jgi:hypothetical protein